MFGTLEGGVSQAGPNSIGWAIDVQAAFIFTLLLRVDDYGSSVFSIGHNHVIILSVGYSVAHTVRLSIGLKYYHKMITPSRLQRSNSPSWQRWNLGRVDCGSLQNNRRAG